MFVNINVCESLAFSFSVHSTDILQRELTGYSPQQQTARVYISCYIHSGTEIVNLNCS